MLDVTPEKKIQPSFIHLRFYFQSLSLFFLARWSWLEKLPCKVLV